MSRSQIDVPTLVGEAKLGKLHVAILVLCFFMLLFDGFDSVTLNIAAPAMIRAFHAEKSAMGIAFSAWYLGVLIGSILIAFVSDRLGRKVGALTCIVLYTLPALGTSLVSSVNELVILRVLGGIGIGGVMPTTLALLAEMAPKRFRASFSMIALLGYPCGTTAMGQVGAYLIPHYGWGVVFITAGIAGLILGAVLLVLLPESMLFLALRKPESAQLRRLAARVAPEDVGPETRFSAPPQEKARGFSMPQLLRPELRTATILIWVAYFADGITYLTLTSWLPVFLETSGLTPFQASLTYSYAASGGIVTSLIILRPLDRFGPWASAVAAVFAIVAMVTLGWPGVPIAVVVGAAIASHAFCGTTHTSLNGTIGSFYPTAIRSNGVGYASAWGRVGSIIGPMVVGYMLSADLPLLDVLIFIAAPEIGLALVCIGLGHIYRNNGRSRAELEVSALGLVSAERR